MYIVSKTMQHVFETKKLFELHYLKICIALTLLAFLLAEIHHGCIFKLWIFKFKIFHKCLIKKISIIHIHLTDFTSKT